MINIINIFYLEKKNEMASLVFSPHVSENK